ncbi:MAG TPA: AcrB/AcrD/AcrF family protein [Sphingomicrobium sp.]|nr:AcrB/AcrD/AcrF family protein [Sphingomicrobium sp.]
MGERKEEVASGGPLGWTGRNWRWLTLLAWGLFCAWFVYSRWTGIHFFALGDTDDNLRMSQVRALLAGQDWYDLRQHRLAGSNIHWSRLVDLPLAGLILLFRPLVGGADAERIAVAVAPMLPFLLLLFALALTVRRLVHRDAFLLAFAALAFAGLTTGMFMPLRIDHHGWQLALLATAVAGLADPRRARGGATLGIASALSLAIGLELLIYLAIAGTAVVLFWLVDRDERHRLSAYAATLAGGTALGFLVFASHANRQPVCDALSPVWLSNALLGGAFLFVMAMLSPADWKRRLLIAAAAAAAIAAFHALAWPHCLSRLEGVSPEVEDLWLSNVREARPVYRHGAQSAALISALPLTGAIGWILLILRNRSEAGLLRRTLAAALIAWVAGLLLLWQTRTGPGAQMLSVTGAVALVWILLPALLASRLVVVRVLGTVAVVVIGLGAAVPLLIDRVAPAKSTPRDRAIGKANRQCNSLPAYRPIAQLPKGMVFTFVDYGPRLITLTHHRGVTGPYHRNGEQIADVMNAFRGSPEQARRLLAKYGADYLLICPNSSTTTIFMAEARNGFYAQLNKGQVPDWLQPVPLPADSPFRMWRVLR